ncbi:hypothetical protein FKP32DRAFT_1582073 [Trametes sanguinea]|nr:hypothetical protein FKP32DRAFT_1582073 [Trametes sanguinea]
MCSDENGAPHATRYVNAQLAVLHENAKKCLQEHPQAVTEENKHFYALAGFAVQKPNATSHLFEARFKAPQLKFICDHDAVLTLTFEKGQFIADAATGNKGQPIKLQDDLNVDFRVHYDATIVSNDFKVDGHGTIVEVIVLDLKSAVVSSVKPPLPNGQDTFLRYLGQYLELLHDAGNHVLYSLPHFSPRPAMDIDFTLTGNSTALEWQESICGITADQFNSYLASLWLKSALLQHSKVATKNTDWRLRVLTEFIKKEEGDFYRIRFGAPRVDILCAKEVVMFFDVDELDFFEGSDFSVAPRKHFAKWKVALIMNVVQERDSEGQSLTISLDFSTARYYEGMSSFPGVVDKDAMDAHYRDLIIELFTEEYLHILRIARYHIIYSRHTRLEHVGKITIDASEEAEGSWPRIEDPVPIPGRISSRDTIQHAKMCGFDQVIAISQSSLNVQFSMISHALFKSWSYGEAFSGTFKPLCVQFLTNSRTIVWIHLIGGKLKTLLDGKPQDEGPIHEFKDWRVAFVVDVKLCTQSELEGRLSETYKATTAYQKHGNKDDRELKHVYLDFSTVEYIHDYSDYKDLNAFGSLTEGRSTMLKIEAIVWYLTEHYLPALSKEGLNVISSIPVFKPGPSLPSYALTSATFQVYCKYEVTRYNWAQVPTGMEPIIVVLGTTGSRPLPTNRLEYSTHWIIQAQRGFSHGTISIARRVFIEERLLHLLSNVNAITTLIPIMVDPLKGFYGVSLKRWAEHEQRKDLASKWQPVTFKDPGYLKYLWEHCEEWHYSLSGNAEIDVSQGIRCITRNTVELPTAVKHGALHIKVSGRVELRLTSLRAGEAHSFSTSSAVSWSTVVTVDTYGSGIKVSTVGSHDPEYSVADYSGNDAKTLRNPADMLRAAFPRKVDLQELVEEIRAFEGAWEYCYPPATPYSLASPVFNADGDLMFELRRHGAAALRGGGPLSPTRGGRPLTPIGRPGSRAGMRKGNKSPPPQTSSSHCKFITVMDQWPYAHSAIVQSFQEAARSRGAVDSPRFLGVHRSRRARCSRKAHRARRSWASSSRSLGASAAANLPRSLSSPRNLLDERLTMRPVVLRRAGESNADD